MLYTFKTFVSTSYKVSAADAVGQLECNVSYVIQAVEGPHRNEFQKGLKILRKTATFLIENVEIG
jgi:hypothetical protein